MPCQVQRKAKPRTLHSHIQLKTKQYRTDIKKKKNNFKSKKYNYICK